MNQIPGIKAAWLARIPHLPIAVDREEAMQILKPHHLNAVQEFAGPSATWERAEQVHGNAVALIPSSEKTIASDGLPIIPGVDGLITQQTNTVLTIYVADCGPIWLVDRKSLAIGLLHSGRKGTETNILGNALRLMSHHFGTLPNDVTVVLGPCIRPPDYEVDFATQIGDQARQAGVVDYFDCGLNTAADLNHNYSYRREMGKTGRMMAMILKQPHP